MKWMAPKNMMEHSFRPEFHPCVFSRLLFACTDQSVAGSDCIAANGIEETLGKVFGSSAGEAASKTAFEPCSQDPRALQFDPSWIAADIGFEAAR